MTRPSPSTRAHITFRPMSQADIPFGQHLCAAAGWNQTEADWRRLIAMAPTGCFLGQIEGEPVGTVAAVAFGPVAWVSMVLVDPAQRGRGIGTALMQHILEHLDAEPGITSARLDATDLGAPIYRKLGFADQFPLVRLQRPADGPAPPPKPELSEAKLRIAPIDAADPADLDTLAALDRAATHTDRRTLLSRLLTEHPDTAWLTTKPEGEPTGYLLARPGADAAQIGPGIAHDRATATALLEHVAAAIGDAPALIDVPAANTEIVTQLTAHGFAEQRRYIRMTRGAAVHEKVPHLLASSGPEKG